MSLISRLISSCLILSIFIFSLAPVVLAEESIKELRSRLESQEDRIQLLEAALKKLGVNLSDDIAEKQSPTAVPQAATENLAVLDRSAPEAETALQSSVSYNKGFLITQKNRDQSFAMRINGRMQFRYTGFDADSRRYELDNGKSGVQPKENDFEIERGRLEFSGHILEEALQYYLNLDFDTDDNHDVKAHDFWFNYKFDPAFDLYAGKAFVPGSREWLDGSTATHLSDRSLATSFFRPDRSLGIWAIGEAAPGFFYRTMLANGFNTTDLEREEIDNQFTVANSFWGNILGDYGKGAADLEWHEDLAVRLGGSFTYSPISDADRGEPIGEADAVRLSDGTKISAEGALAPGITVDEYDIFLYAVDLAFKYRGWGFNSEAYYRTISNIQGQGGESLESYSDKGLTTDLGYFLMEAMLEMVGRFSYIDGDIADSSEYAWGLNYYIDGSHRNKLSFDMSWLDDSPVNSSGPNYFVGANGVLYRLQWQIGF